jgi:ABC-2 type transport system permease protein
MLLVGVYLVPLLGGEALELGHSPGGLALMAGAISFGAIGYALLISVVARTTEQATVLGGAGSILLGAIGGIMVPKFLMPEAMQTFSWVSPMAWGLEGFLDVLLRQGSARDVLPEAAVMGAFGLIALLAAAELFRRRAD